MKRAALRAMHAVLLMRVGQWSVETVTVGGEARVAPKSGAHNVVSRALSTSSRTLRISYEGQLSKFDTPNAILL